MRLREWNEAFIKDSSPRIMLISGCSEEMPGCVGDAWNGSISLPENRTLNWSSDRLLTGRRNLGGGFGEDGLGLVAAALGSAPAGYLRRRSDRLVQCAAGRASERDRGAACPGCRAASIPRSDEHDTAREGAARLSRGQRGENSCAGADVDGAGKAGPQPQDSGHTVLSGSWPSASSG